MDNNNSGVNDYHDEIDLRELFSVLWAGKINIIIITALFAVGSVFYALSIPHQYRATALLAPAQSDGGGLSGALSQLGGLASLAGVSISGGESSESQIAREIMRSWSFIDKFIEENRIAPALYAVKGWNKGTGTLQFDEEIYDISTKKWVIENDWGEMTSPTSWNLYTKFSSISSVAEEKITGIITVSIEYYSPELAKQWLDRYISAINKHMQARQVAKVSNNIKYLEAQIERTAISGMREVFYTIIEEQIKNKMVAEASPDYAFVAVGQAMVPEVKSKPNRPLICILGTLMGGVFSGLLVIVLHYGRRTT